MASMWEITLDAVKIADNLATSSNLDIIRNDLNATLKLAHGGFSGRIFFFGSRVISVGNENSDLDIYSTYSNNFYNFSEQPTSRVTSELDKILEALTKKSGMWRVVKNVRFGKVPIIVVVHRSTGIQCDINVSHGISYAQNQIVKYLFQVQPIGRYMCLYLRKIFEKHCIIDVFRPHVIILMVIFFLQRQHLLPSIEQLQKNKVSDMGPWISVIEEQTLAENGMLTVDLNSCQLNKYIEMFFQYYANFNFHYAISPYLGKEVTEKSISSRMPPRYRNYVNGDRKKGLNSSRPIIVQDFVHLNQNKGIRVSRWKLSSFKMLCQKY